MHKTLLTYPNDTPTFAKPGYIQRAIALGVAGFILKEASSNYLVNSL